MLEAVLQSLGDHMHDAVLITEAGPAEPPGPNIVWCNPVFAKMVGSTREELVGKPTRIMRNSRVDDATKQRIIEGLKGKKTFSETLLNYREDGNLLWAELHVKPVLDQAGEVQYWVATQRDVTERRQMSERLEQARRQLESCADAGEIGLWEVSPDLTCSFFSNKNYRLLGHDGAMADAEGMGFWLKAIHPDDLDKLNGAMVQHFDSGEPLDLTYRIQHLDGSYRWWRTTGQSHRAEGGQAVILSGVNQDVTELREAQNAAAEANRLKSEFLANMSHEIRTPLNGVLGMTQLLETTQLAPKQKRYVDRINNAGRTLLGIISDVLDISKIETGVLQLELAQFNIADLLDQVRDTVNGIAAAKELEFTVETDIPSDCFVRGDANRIRQVLVNLAGNAIKFTDDGFVKVTAALHGDALRFEVIDSGPGIPLSRQDDIFGRFTQLDGSSTRKHGGTGLGLAIAKDVVSLMGGDLRIESELGSGSRFWFEVKSGLLQDEATTQCSPNGGEAGGDGPVQRGDRTLRILAAEDNDLNQLILQEVFEDDDGIALRLVDNGLQAVESASEEHFDLILMDINMPILTGDEALRHIRTGNGPNKSTPLFVLTANAGLDNRRAFLAAGADDCMIKPINIGVLKQTIELLRYEPVVGSRFGKERGLLGRMFQKNRPVREPIGYACHLPCKLDSGEGAALTARVDSVSGQGADIFVLEPATLPPFFRLVFDGGNITILCRLVWQDSQNAGAEFIMSEGGDRSKDVLAMVDTIRAAASHERN